jgi:hypothetical protein
MPNEAYVLIATIIALVVIGIAAARFRRHDHDQGELDDDNP